MQFSLQGKRLYYVSYFARANYLFRHVTPVMLVFLSFPKLVLEVFIRDRMGHRYCNPVSLILVGLGLYFLPGFMEPGSDNWHPNFMYHLFFGCYAIMAVYRYWKIRPKRGVFDNSIFSVHNGDPLAFFERISIPGVTTDRRNIECYFEPIFCVLIGLLFLLFKQYPVAYTIFICSFCYFVSNAINAALGDHAIWDIIDITHCKSQLLDILESNEPLRQVAEEVYKEKPTFKDMNGSIGEVVAQATQAAKVS